MRIYISDKHSENFVYHYLPKLIKKVALEELGKLDKRRDIFGYIKNEYKVSVKEIIKNLDDYIIVSKLGHFYCIVVDKYRKYKNVLYTEILDLIDVGNLDYKGLDIVRHTENYICNMLPTIYRDYLRRGGK